MDHETRPKLCLDDPDHRHSSLYLHQDCRHK